MHHLPMSVRLEPVFLANVLLLIDNAATIKVFPHVSKNCREATLTLKVNPAVFSTSPRQILKCVPNTNTMVVDEHSCLQKTHSLPETVTGVVLKSFGRDSGRNNLLKFADRVVEIRKCDVLNNLDLSHFSSIQKTASSRIRTAFSCHTTYLSASPFTSFHEMKTPLEVFPLACSEQLVLIFAVPDIFLKAKQLPPHVRLFCSTPCPGLTLSKLSLQSFLEHQTLKRIRCGRAPRIQRQVSLQYNAVGVELEEDNVNGDISFMTLLNVVLARELAGGTLILPSSVVDLDLLGEFRGGTVFGTDYLTCQSSHHCCVSFAPFFNLQWLGFDCRRIYENIPFSWIHSTALTSMKVTAGCVEPGFRFSPNLVRMELRVDDSYYDDATFTPLTRLESLDIYIRGKDERLDLSALVSLPRLHS